MKLKFQYLVIIATTLTIAIPTQSSAGVSRTSSFKMSLTIPAVVGINLPSENTDPNSRTLGELNQDLMQSEEIALRDGEKVLITTLVVR